MAGKAKAAPEAVDEAPRDVVELESVPADPSSHQVAMQSLLADGTPEHPDAVVLVEDDDPRAVHFQG